MRPLILFPLLLLVTAALGGCALKNRSRADKPVAVPEQRECPDKAGAWMKPEYCLRAEASGCCIDFQLTNTGTSELKVSPYDFCLIPRNTHQTVPYSPEGAAIEAPATIAPGQTVSGRAVFNEFKAPRGSRLVFKPDQQGTFAQIAEPAAGQGQP